VPLDPTRADGQRPDVLSRHELSRRKPIDGAPDQTSPGGDLHRVLGAGHLTLLAVGAIVGGGIFSSIGQMAAGGPDTPGAGPALVVSYVLTAIACGFAALCYAEIAALVPTAGSAYSYAYAAFGELWAWIIGWDLIIEYAIGNVYVAQSWADYFRSFLRGFAGLDFPAWLASDFQSAAADPAIRAAAPTLGGHVVAVNLPAAAITVLLTVLLVAGIRESARANSLLVLFKIALVVLFVAVGAVYVEPAHWRPFAPGGWRGIWTGASLAFFSYIGFDAISTAAEETRDPQRALPRAMLASLAICSVLYVATALVMTGLVPSSELATGDPLALALRRAGLDRLATLMSFGAVVAVTAVLLVFQLGQPRILLAMARDGLLPPAFARLHARRRTPVVGTVATGIFVAVMPSLLTPAQALELTSIGTLFAFIVVAGGVIALRRREPDRPRPFRCPGYPFTPLASIAASFGLMLGLPATNWWRFAIWLALGLVVYALYGRRHSRLRGR
jgi:basic amino acid/polyamine antiporter, APA family